MKLRNIELKRSEGETEVYSQVEKIYSRRRYLKGVRELIELVEEF